MICFLSSVVEGRSKHPAAPKAATQARAISAPPPDLEWLVDFTITVPRVS